MAGERVICHMGSGDSRERDERPLQPTSPPSLWLCLPAALLHFQVARAPVHIAPTVATGLDLPRGGDAIAQVDLVRRVWGATENPQNWCLELCMRRPTCARRPRCVTRRRGSLREILRVSKRFFRGSLCVFFNLIDHFFKHFFAVCACVCDVCVNRNDLDWDDGNGMAAGKSSLSCRTITRWCKYMLWFLCIYSSVERLWIRVQ